MSWLLFLDESGHDHKHCPYEVRGGIAIHAGKLWAFVQQLQDAEIAAFGAPLHDYQKEIKGAKLLDKDRFKWANQDAPMNDSARRKHCRGLQYRGQGSREGRVFDSYGIVYVPDPYGLEGE